MHALTYIRSTTCKKTPVSSALPVPWTLRSSKPAKSISKAQAEKFGVEHVYQTCIVVLLANPTNGQETIGHRPASPGRRGPGCLESKHALVQVHFRKYIDENCESIAHTDDRSILGILLVVKIPIVSSQNHTALSGDTTGSQ